MPLMNMRLPSKKSLAGIISAVIVIAVLAMVVPAVSAEGTGPLTPIPGLGRLSNLTLVHMHTMESGWYNDQNALLQKADKLDVSFQALITTETKTGKDVSSLQDALATYENELTASKAIHAQAAVIIFGLAGWKGGNGDVKDRLAAGQSLLDGRDALADANFRLNNGMKVLEKSFVTYRAKYIHGVPVKFPTPTP